MQELTERGCVARITRIAAVHVKGQDDKLVRFKPLLKLVDDRKVFLYKDVKKGEVDRLHLYERTRQPLGDGGFIGSIENMIRKVL